MCLANLSANIMCFSSISLSIDHHGGSIYSSNLATLCIKCPARQNYNLILAAKRAKL